LKLEQLNGMAKKLNKDLKATSEEDFLEEESKEDDKLKLGFEIVLHILNTKKDEAKARKEYAEKRAKKIKLLEALAKKQDANLENMSEEDLIKELDALS